MGQEFPISGGIDPASFPFLLANLHQQGATGSLRVDGATYQKALYFRGGRILFGSSNDPRDQLGAILIESGRLSNEQLDEASAKVGPGNPLAKVLADGGLVTQRELGEAAKLKVERILCDLLTIDEGTFEFEDDVLPKGAIDLKLPTPRLFISALRRVEGRAFVRRHLGGPDVVLRLSPTASTGMAEVFGDVAGLPELLDGRRPLREAAALARMDEDEVARLACALLFLGLVQKAPQDTFQPIVSEEDELDFAPTARINLGDLDGADDEPMAGADAGGDLPFFLSNEPDAAPPPAPSAPVFAIDPAVFAPAESEVEPTVMLPRATAAEATAIVPPPRPPQPEPEPEAEPTVVLRPPAPAAAPAAPVAPVAPVAPPVKPHASGLPLIPPPPRVPAARPRPAAVEAEPTLEPRPASSRPSRADLEALDSLLNARPLETPLAGSTSTSGSGPTPAARRPLAWDPSFGRGAPARGRRAPAGASGSRLPLILGGVTVALLLAGGGGWWWLNRPKATPPSPAARPAAGVVRPRPLPDAGAPASPAATADGIPATTPSAAPSPAAVASAAPPVTSPPVAATPHPAAGGPDEARAQLRAGNLGAAAAGFRAMLRAAPGGSYSIQLLIACAPETIAKAVAGAGGPELLVVPIRYQGRDCHRVCWGLYDGRARADSALRSVPAYFREGGNKPKVMAASELLQ